jgi:O-antigen/teichoic acid export membrane protein
MTDTTPETILAKTAKGAGWIIGWRMVTRVLGMMSQLFLVRLLLPSDFGLVMLASGFAQSIDALSSLGVEEAVIREKNPTRELYDSAFTINVIRSLTTACILAVASWPVAQFFGDPRLFNVMLALAAGSTIGGLENVGIIEFRRNMQFDREFQLLAIPRLVSIVLAISLSYLWHSYWALIVAMQVGGVLRIVLTYVFHPFRPRLGLKAWRQIAGFSLWSWLLSLTSLARDRCDTFVIGRLLDITQVGIFSAGVEIAMLPATELVAPLQRASFSGFAATRHATTDAATIETYLRVLSSAALLSVPASIGISLVADLIVRLAFGARWLAATIVIEVTGIGLSLMVLGMISAALLNAYGLLRGIFKVQCVAIGVRIPLAIVMVSHFGLLGGAIAGACGTALEHLLNMTMALRRLRLTPLDLLRCNWRTLLGTASMILGMRALGMAWATAPEAPGEVALVLTRSIAAGAAIYGGTVALLWLASGRPAGAERDLLELLRRLTRRATSVLRKQWVVLHGHG